ncbi:hypothetical protein LCGC14_0538210 [marine sediment metagenome]|uniref:Uncharacterized protein n=1 Tax=marine sediment metagenome TaxID=412755 RepID=A0A0F9V1U7_9ZZZZ|nr:hypothetical protein [bacterium]
MSEDEDKKEFETEGNFAKKEGFSKPALVAIAIQNCINKMSVEMREGYKTYFLDKQGNAFVKIIPDTRKEFIGSVLGLSALLTSEINRFKEVKDKLKVFHEERKKIREKYIYKEREFVPTLIKDKKGHAVNSQTNNILFKTIIKPDGREWMPEKTDKLPSPTTKIIRNLNESDYKELATIYVIGVWDYEINRYWEEILELCGDWFIELNDLITDKIKNFSGDMTG